MSPTDRLLVALGDNPTKEGAKIRDRIITGTLQNALTAQTETGSGVKARHVDIIIAKYIAYLEDPTHDVTSKDMVALMKLMGEEISKSQSVKVTVNSTDAYLASMAHGAEKKDPKKKEGE